MPIAVNTGGTTKAMNAGPGVIVPAPVLAVSAKPLGVSNSELCFAGLSVAPDGVAAKDILSAVILGADTSVAVLGRGASLKTTRLTAIRFVPATGFTNQKNPAVAP